MLEGGEVERSARISRRFLNISKTLSRNPQGSAVSLKQLNFRQKEMPLKHNLNKSSSIALDNVLLLPPKKEIFLEQVSHCLAVPTTTKQ